jgi:hypothetical protein
MTDKVIVILPVFGSPYVECVMKKGDKNMLKTLQKCVGGFIDKYDQKQIRIHPMFVNENARWRMGEALMKDSKTIVWVNEEGARDCSPNMATIIPNPQLRVGGCPHIFGDIALEVPLKAFERTGINQDWLTVIARDVEPEDEDDEEKMKAEYIAKGNEWLLSSGVVYKTPAPAVLVEAQ